MFPPDPNEPRLIRWMRNPGVRRTLIFSLLWTATLATLFYFSEVLLPFGLAILIAFVIEPVVGWASAPERGRMRLPRLVTVLAVYAVVAAVSTFFVRSVLPEIARDLGRLGKEGADFFNEFDALLVSVFDQLEAVAVRNNIPIDRQELEGFVRQNLDSLTATATDNAGQLFTLGKRVLAGLVQTIFGSFVVLMLTAFLSADARRIGDFALSLVPPDYLSSYRDIIGGITRGLGGVVRGQIFICLTNGVLTFIGLWIFEVRFPFVMALVASVFSLIPIFGSILSTLPIVGLALTDSLPKGVFVLLWIIGIHLIEANILNPKIMGDAARIHPVLVVFALIAGERTAGLIGALFAVPIASVLLEFFKFLHRRALEAGRVADRGPAASPIGGSWPPAYSKPPSTAAGELRPPSPPTGADP